jgi:putative aminopeptidase
MHRKLRQRIADYTQLNAPVGFEEPVLRRTREELAAVCERVAVDVRGNVYAHLPGTAADAPRVMITAHADEIGFLVTSITRKGFLRFTRLGHPTEMVLPGQRVRVLSAGGPLDGVIGVKPGHVLSGDEAHTVPPIEALYIDVGATSSQQVAEWGIDVGTPAVFVGELTPTHNPNRCFGKCPDNRAGVVAVLEIAERLAKSPPAASVVFVITVEEEIGLRGAAVAAARVQPDVLLVIDTVPSGGTPDLSKEQLPWDIGDGALLKVREIKGLSTHGPLRKLVQQTAQEHGIRHKLIVDTAGITDATSAQQASGDIAAMVIALARRYSHSAVEMFDLTDVEAIIDLTCRVTRRITSVEQLLRV